MEPSELSKRIADVASIELQQKFLKGQKEHGGDFLLKPTARNIREEALDLINYSHVLELHIGELEVMTSELQHDLPSLDIKGINDRLTEIRTKIYNL